MSHTTEIRERVLAYIEEGGLIKTACQLFGVSRSSIQRWRLRKAVVGILSPVERINVPYKIDDEALRRYIETHPDAHLNELARHFGLTPSGIWRALKCLKITRKKKSTLYADRDEQKRQNYLAQLANHLPEKLVYIDESGIDTFIARDYGWSCRGKKILAEVSGRCYV
ncbi:TPA: IS630 transposase-related protein [Legionella pneumophila]|uniref:Putative transposase n=1 Tax=Legionella pneumophila TaxID=446 RepID=A0A378K5Y8_LEGPN|nr:IS630 transposase-related protein [Legionella pneumophila]MCW8402860.1 transposase [Legionella pneumophila]MCZ4696959.1 IS630 transposase-related protein [Legionella pneumophila]MCZ4713390.1 IS630 transposase-related protein [Legionella pneumophila]MCZ4743704.1 IS630 transposase-related protein [Legionella pneumophila]MCZ4758264.1 IS630 transposase-related protein [Legionella pneumophila]